MILDSINNILKYQSFSPFIERIAGILELINIGKFDPALPMEFDDGFKIVFISKLIDDINKNNLLERHRSNIDFHYVLKGTDEIGLKKYEQCHNCIRSYESDGDYELFMDNPEYRVKLNQGDFMIIAPEHAHSTLQSNGYVEKIVFKMPIQTNVELK